MADMFATVDELRTYAQAPDMEDATATQALELATALVQAEAGRRLLRSVTTDVLTAPRSAYLELPEKPVHAVTGLSGVTGGVTTVLDPSLFWRSGTLLFDLTGWHRYDSVTVTYDHGYDSIPEDVKAVVLGAASRFALNPQGIRSETIGQYTYQLAGDTNALAEGLSTYERIIVRRYRGKTHAMVR